MQFQNIYFYINKTLNFFRYIFNATFDAKAECDAETPNVERYNKFCAGVVRFDWIWFEVGRFYYHSQWDKGGKGLVLTSPSLNKKRAADGVSIGDDICK